MPKPEFVVPFLTYSSHYILVLGLGYRTGMYLNDLLFHIDLSIILEVAILPVLVGLHLDHRMMNAF